ncbi:MAG: hypothetical protein FJ398_19275 [Verrucomicrobia bacterium]|nr:hypothetical protein [Verrucomicrobiota bacterium]
MLAGPPLPAALQNLGMHLLAWNSFAPLQLVETDLNLLIEPSAKSFAILAEFKPFQQRFSLVFVQVFYLFNGQFKATHDGKLSVATWFCNPCGDLVT